MGGHRSEKETIEQSLLLETYKIHPFLRQSTSNTFRLWQRPFTKVHANDVNVSFAPTFFIRFHLVGHLFSFFVGVRQRTQKVVNLESLHKIKVCLRDSHDVSPSCFCVTDSFVFGFFGQQVCVQSFQDSVEDLIIRSFVQIMQIPDSSGSRVHYAIFTLVLD